VGTFGALTAVSGIATVALGYTSPNAQDLITYRPSNWSNPFWQPAVMVIVPAGAPQYSSTSVANDGQVVDGVLSVTHSESSTSTPAQTYVWDGYPRVEHEFQSVATQYPVQYGASGTDGAFNVPRRLVVELVSSDALQSYIPNQFSQGLASGSDPYLMFTQSKSVNAYQTLRGLWEQNLLLTVVTRLDSYSNMMIVGGKAIDDNSTQNGLRCIVQFQEIIAGQIAQTSTASSRDDTVSPATYGQQQVSSPSAAAQSQYTATPSASSTLPGAGTLTSNPIGS
jgi:hypothetical protein